MVRPRGFEPGSISCCSFVATSSLHSRQSRSVSGQARKTRQSAGLPCLRSEVRIIQQTTKIPQLKLRYFCGSPEENRTPDLWYRKPTLYPAELRAHAGYCNSFTLLPVWAGLRRTDRTIRADEQIGQNYRGYARLWAQSRTKPSLFHRCCGKCV